MPSPVTKIEWERKFLLNGTGWKALVIQTELIHQAYLCTFPNAVRVRFSKNKAILTIKGKNQSAHNLEFETKIPAKDGQSLLDLCPKPAIVKRRHRLNLSPGCWIVDQFLNQNEGLWLAEIELDTQNELNNIDLNQGWLGKEVSQDIRYTNAHLYENPYPSWAGLLTK